MKLCFYSLADDLVFKSENSHNNLPGSFSSLSKSSPGVSIFSSVLLIAVATSVVVFLFLFFVFVVLMFLMAWLLQVSQQPGMECTSDKEVHQEVASGL